MALDRIKTLKVKKQAAEISVDIYDLLIQKEEEIDSTKKNRLANEILRMQQNRQRLLDRVQK